MTRKQAFFHVINQRGVHKTLRTAAGSIRSLRKRFNDGEPVSDDKMKEILEAYGARLIQEEQWEI